MVESRKKTLNVADKAGIKNEFFGIHAAAHVDEFFGLLNPHPITTLMFQLKNGAKIFSYKIDDSHVTKIYVPKIGKGKFNNPAGVTRADFLFYAASTVFFLPKILRYKKIIFHTPPFFDTIIIPVLKLFRKKVYICTIDWQLMFPEAYGYGNIFMRTYYKTARLLEILAVKQANKVFATSKFIVEDYKKYNKNVIYVPNGADVDDISKIKTKRYFKDFTITYMGGFEMWRGMDMLVDAFNAAKKKGLKGKLLFIGGGPDADKLKEYAKGNKDIAIIGPLGHDEAIAYCKGSDILAMPSRDVIASQTISSIKCFEYIACEVPTLVTDSGEHAYWIKKMGAGLVVKDDTESITKGILDLYNNKKLYNQSKNNCKKNKHLVDYKKLKEPFVKEVLND